MSSRDLLHSKKATLRINYFEQRKLDLHQDISNSMKTSKLGTLEEPRCPEGTAVASCETSDSSHSKSFTWTVKTNANCGDLKQAALQVDPESVARPVPCDLGMHSLNAHCILKLYNIYMGFQWKDIAIWTPQYVVPRQQSVLKRNLYFLSELDSSKTQNRFNW